MENKEPQEPKTEDQVWFISKFIVIMLLDTLILLGTVAASLAFFGGFNNTGHPIIGLLAAVWAFSCGITAQKDVTRRLTIRFLLPDAKKIGAEEERDEE